MLALHTFLLLIPMSFGVLITMQALWASYRKSTSRARKSHEHTQQQEQDQAEGGPDDDFGGDLLAGE